MKSPCLGTSITRSERLPRVPWEWAQPGRMRAGELQLGSEMSLVVLTYFTDPGVSGSKIFPFWHLCPARGFSKRGNALFPGRQGCFLSCCALQTCAGAGLQGCGPYPDVGQLSCENWDGFGAELVSWLVFVRAEVVFTFPRRLQTQLKCIKQLKRRHIITEFLFSKWHSCDLDLFSECFGESMA